MVLRLTLVALLLTAGCGTPVPGPAAPAAADVAGSWTGRLDLPGAPLDLGITLTGGPGAPTGMLDVPVQGITALPLADVAVDGATIRFAVPGLPGNASFAGTLAADASAIGGTFTQGGKGYPLVLHRGAVAMPARPQQPQPPFPYRTEDVVYRGRAGDLAGTMTFPGGSGPFPAVLLVTGSGAQDRDETIAGRKPFLLLADRLTRVGTAVLRVDDRGVGGSAGSTADATYDDLVDDIGAGLAYLRGRPEVDPARVGLLGHSEGGYLAPLTAQRLPGEVAFVVMLAGPAVSGEDVLVEQNRQILTVMGQTPQQVDEQIAFVDALCRLLRARDDDAARALIRDRVRAQVAALPPDQRAGAEQQAQMPVDEALRAFATYDPAPALDALRVPVLAVYGSKDLQVPAAQSEPVLRQRLAGDADATVRILDVNHLMQPAGTGLPQEYATIPTTIDPQVLDLVSTWVRAQA